MSTRAKLLMAALTAALALSIAAGSASALRSLSPSATTMSSNGVVSFKGSGTTVQCPATLVRTLSSSWPKTEGVLIGAIIDVRTNRPEPECFSTTGRLLEIRILGLNVGELWRLFYESISGTLPNITALHVIVKHIQASFTIEPGFGSVRCLYEQEEGGRGLNAEEAVSSGVLGTITIGRNTSNRNTNFGCPERGELAGRLRPLNTITLRLT